MNSTIKALGLSIALAVGLGVATPALATELRIGTVLAPDDPMGQGLEKFKQEVEAATNGEVTVQVFHNSQLGDTTEMIDQARAGANVGTVTDVARLSSFVPSLAIMSAPFLFDTYDEADKFALSDEYLAWGDELKDKSGLVMLASNWYQGARHALTQKPIAVPADLNGVRMRTIGAPSRPRSPGARFIQHCSWGPSTLPRRSQQPSGVPSSMKSLSTSPRPATFSS